jgi:hypothetical protein
MQRKFGFGLVITACLALPMSPATAPCAPGAQPAVPDHSAPSAALQLSLPSEIHPRHRPLSVSSLLDPLSFAPGSSVGWQVLPPPSVGDQCLVYDSRRDRILMIGGVGEAATNAVWSTNAEHTSWERIRPNGTPPTPRYGASAVYDSAADRVHVFGGTRYDAYYCNNELWSLELAPKPTWRRIEPAGASPRERRGASLVLDPPHDRLVLFGGQRDTAFLSDLWTFDLAKSEWHEQSVVSSPPGRSNAAGVITRGDLYVIGGNNRRYYLRDTWKLVGQSLTWEPVFPNDSVGPPYDVCGAIQAPASDAILLVGGRTDSLLWRLDPTRGWSVEPLLTRGPGGRNAPAIALDSRRGRILLSAGWTLNGSSFYGWTQETDLWALTIDDHYWQRLSDESAGPRFRHGAVLDSRRDRLIVIAGLGSGLSRVADTWAYALDSGRWTRLGSPGEGPSARMDPLSVYDPIHDRVVVFGGSDCCVNYNEVYFDDLWYLPLNPEAHWHQQTALGDPPQRRRVDTCVYDPVREAGLFFGSSGDSGDTTLVWSLELSDPPVWRRLVVAGPAPLAHHGASITYDPFRDRVILFGGARGSQSQNDTWTLELQEPPRWRPLQTTGYAEPLTMHSAVFDPRRDRMLVFGGFDIDWDLIYGSGSLMSLSLRDEPAWTYLRQSGDYPGARHGHGALYDPANDAMVISGGFASGVRDEVFRFPFGEAGASIGWFVGTQLDRGTPRLRWLAPGAAQSSATLERSEAGDTWLILGSALADSVGRIEFADGSARAGKTYSYRVAVKGPQGIARFGEVLIDVPGSTATALREISPNPTSGAINSRVYIANNASAKIELFDVSGRRVATQALNGLAQGDHRVTFAAPPRAGVYLLRLTTEVGTETAKVVLLR